jgi:hypothetical protein
MGPRNGKLQNGDSESRLPLHAEVGFVPPLRDLQPSRSSPGPNDFGGGKLRDEKPFWHWTILLLRSYLVRVSQL